MADDRVTKPGGVSYSDQYERWSHGNSPSASEEARIQYEISRVMADVIRHDARHNPNALSPPATATPVGAQRVDAVDGWQEGKPLRLPSGQDEIKRLVDTFQPHGKDSGAG